MLLTPQAAAVSVRELRSRKIHPHFPGYLCVLRAAFAAGTTHDLQVSFRQFYDDFLVYGNPTRRYPYLTPFSVSKGRERIFFNQNPAGSYAPRSIRPGYPFAQVVSARGSKSGSLYTLTSDHTQAALRSLLYGRRLSVTALALFLYRDYGFALSEGDLNHDVLVGSSSENLDFILPLENPILFRSCSIRTHPT